MPKESHVPITLPEAIDSRQPQAAAPSFAARCLLVIRTLSRLRPNGVRLGRVAHPIVFATEPVNKLYSSTWAAPTL